jgi:hypothetical protein
MPVSNGLPVLVSWQVYLQNKEKYYKHYIEKEEIKDSVIEKH